MEVANLYDNGPISPIAKIKQNIAVWTEQHYVPYQIDFIEPIPSSSPFVVDVVAAAGLITIPGFGQAAKNIVTALQMNDKELLHLRFEPLDDVEGAIWELPNAARFAPRGGQARVTPFTADRDPWLCTTTFYILGQNKDINLGAFNNEAAALPYARFAFWGYRYVISGPLDNSAMAAGKSITYLPAQSM
ncbi:MAG: hypothetical protein ACYDHZ_00695 [Dehalococcoidia bacterium]